MTNGARSELTRLPIVVAYLILAHKDPEQLARLVAALPANSPIMIHFDLRADPALFDLAVKRLGMRPKLQFVERFACHWGGFEIVQGMISLIRSLASCEINFDFATLLSGVDYPIKSNREVAAFLNQHRGEEFIKSFLLTAPNRWSEHGGYYKIPNRVLCRHLSYRSRVVRLPGFRKMPGGLQPYGGSQWWTLSRDAIAYIARFVDRRREFLSFFRRSFIPDELFIQTVLSNSHFADRVAQDDLRFMIWDRPAPPYPATLTLRDLDVLLASNKFFARKFDMHIDADILQALDDRNARAEVDF